MVPHQDLYARLVTEDPAALGYYQPFLVLTEQGVDYDAGGAFIDLDDQRVVFEAACQVGDVVVYDGRTMHGVADVDPLRPLELDRFGGRVAAFASLFRHLTPEGPSYEEIGKQAIARFGLGSG